MSETEATVTEAAAPTEAASTSEPASNNLLAGARETAAQQASWLDGLDQQYLQSQTVANAQSPNDLAKQVFNLEKVMGKPKLPMPQDDWSSDQWNDFHNKLGRPETVDGYQLNYQSDSFTFSDDDKGNLQQAFYDAGLSQTQAEKLFNTVAQREEAFAKSVAEKADSQNQEALNALQNKWGDKFDNNVRMANFALQKLAGEHAQSIEDKYGSDPQLADLLYNASLLMADDSTFKGEMNSNSWVNPGAAQAEIANLKTDAQFVAALTDKSNLGHKEALEKWNNLHKIAAG